MTIRLDRLLGTIKLVKRDGGASPYFVGLWQTVMKAIEDALNSVIAAQTAADTANAAAAAATTAAATANAAATTVSSESALATSGVSGLTMTATDAGTNATITISAHTRVYGDGTSVSVSGGSLTGRAYSTAFYVYYDDPARTGGSVTYQTTTTPATAAQTGNRHSLGTVTTPASGGGPVTGKKNLPAGVVEP